MFRNVLKPIVVGGVALSNRIGLAPINTGLFDSEGNLKPRGLDFFRQYFENAVGLAYIGGVAVTPQGRSSSSSFLLDSEDSCGGLQILAETAHQYGSKIAVQLMHAGRQTNPTEVGGPIVACSPIPCPIVNVIPTELTLVEIQRVIESFAKSALIAEKCGVDLVEIHAAHGYLVSGFLSPYSNVRKDQYGGRVGNRFRILLEIIDAVKARVSIPVGIRINCVENAVNGLQFHDVLFALTSMLEPAIDFVSISGGVYSTDDIIMPPRRRSQLWKSFGKAIKEKIKTPVFLAGNISTIRQADTLVRKDYSDVILMARSLLADPLILSKSIENRENEVQECIDCKQCKYHTIGLDSIYCPFNPVLNALHRNDLPLIRGYARQLRS